MVILDQAHQLVGHVFFLDDGVADVGPVKAADKLLCLLQMQTLDDVSACQVVCRRRQCYAWHARIALVQHAQGAVFGPEVVPPLAHAVRFVNRKQGQLALREQVIQQAQKTRGDQALWGHIQQRQLATLHLPFHILRLLPVERGVEERRFDARLMQGPHLIVHECNQG